MKTILFLIILIFTPILLFAQISIKGQVSEYDSNTPLVGAFVFIANGKEAAITDSNGEYSLNVKKTGSYVLKVSYIRYTTITDSITIKSVNNMKNFDMKVDPMSLDEIVVRGSSQKSEIKKIRDSPMAVTVVDGVSLRGRANGIEDVLTRTSGIKVRKSGGLGSSSRLSIHGLEGKRVAVYVDGFPLNSPDGSFDINDIPVDLIRYIEVYKGIVPAEYGGDDLGGAINIVTREDDCDLIGITQEFASYGTSKSMVAVKKVFEKQGIQVGLGGFYNRSNNNYTMIYPHYDPGLPNDAYKSVIRNNDHYSAGMINAEILFTKLWFDRFGVEISAYKNKKGIQVFDFDSRSAYTHGVNIMPSILLEKRDFLIKNLHLKFDGLGSYANTHLVDTTTVRYQWNGNTTTSVGETTDNLLNLSDDKQWNIQGRLNLKYIIKENHSLNFNNQYSYTKQTPYDPYVEEYVNYNPSGYPNTAISNISGLSYNYISNNRRLQLSLAGKSYFLKANIFDAPNKNEQNNGIKNNNISKNYFGYSAGISYELFKGLRVKTSFARSVRIPSSFEFFGDGNLTKPSLKLQPEKSDSYNLGVIFNRVGLFRLDRVQIESNIYYMQIKDLISLQSIDIVRLAYANLGESNIMGVDAEIKIDVTKNWYGYFNITSQRVVDNMKYKADGQTSNLTYGLSVPNIPTFYYNYGIEYHIEGFLGINELSRIYIDGSYVGGYSWAWQLSSDAQSIAKWNIPQTHIFNIGLQQSFLKNQLSLGFEVENVFNQKTFQEFRMPLQGRTFKLKLRYNLFRDKISGGAMGI